MQNKLQIQRVFFLCVCALQAAGRIQLDTVPYNMRNRFAYARLFIMYWCFTMLRQLAICSSQAFVCLTDSPEGRSLPPTEIVSHQQSVGFTSISVTLHRDINIEYRVFSSAEIFA